jgi:tetratricopeptide (TPR) repeat protein
MPLAIEHAAAQISSMSPREMRDRLQDKFRFLKSRHRGPFTRHATMQSTIDWSYDLLLDDEKKLLPLLSIFRGSWDLSLCREIAGAIGFTKWQTEDSLDGLVSKSLVSLDSVQEDARLFRLLEMIKAYAAERLGPEIETKCLARLCGYYYAFAATQNEATLNRWVGQDLPNIGRVVEWAVAAKDARCLELIHSIRNILRRGGHAKRGGEMLSILLRGEVTTDPALLARGWNALGMMLWNQDLFHESMEAFERSRSYYLNLFDEESIIGVENNLAIINAELGRSEEAIELFEKVLTGYRRLNNVALIAQVNGNLASLKYNMGDAPGAVSHFEEVGGAGMEDPSVRANFLKNYALALVEAGRPGEAEVQLSRAFAIWQDVPDLLALSGALIGIAHLRMNCSEDSKVARLIGASHMVEQRTGSQRSAGERRLLISVESYLRSHMEPAAMTRATKLGQAFTVQNALNLAKDLLPASKAGLLA